MKNIFWKKCHILYLLVIGIGIIGIVIGQYEKFHIGILSVSADKKIEFIGIGPVHWGSRGLRAGCVQLRARLERGLSEV